PGQSVPVKRPAMQNRSIAARHISFDAHGPDHAVGMAQQPALGLVVALVAEGQAVVLCKVVGNAWNTVPGKISGCGYDDASIISQSQAYDAGIVELADTDGAVVTL